MVGKLGLWRASGQETPTCLAQLIIDGGIDSDTVSVVSVASFLFPARTTHGCACDDSSCRIEKNEDNTFDTGMAFRPSEFVDAW